MRTDGAAVKFAVSFFLVENIPVHFHVMRACVGAVKSKSKLAAIVENCRPKCYANPRTTRKTAESFARMVLKKSGLAALVVGRLATVLWTVANILVKRVVIPKTRSLLTVHGLRMSFWTAPVERRRFLRSRGTHPGHLVKIQSSIARNLVARPYPVAILATNCVTPVPVALVCAKFPSNASAAAPTIRPSATRVSMNPPCARVSARLTSTAVVTRALIDAALESKERTSVRLRVASSDLTFALPRRISKRNTFALGCVVGR